VGSANADLIDSVLSGGNQSGYKFSMAAIGSGTPLTGYSVGGDPVAPNTSERADSTPISRA